MVQFKKKTKYNSTPPILGTALIETPYAIQIGYWNCKYVKGSIGVSFTILVKCDYLNVMYVFVHMFVCRDCRVVKDMATGKSKGYGFVSFFNKWVSVSSMLLCFSRFSLKKYYCCTSYVSVKIVESFSLHILYITSIQSFSCQLASLNVFPTCRGVPAPNIRMRLLCE